MRYQIFSVFIILLVPVWFIGCTNTTSSDKLIEYRRTGGFIGFDDYLVINTNGEVTLSRKNKQNEFILDSGTMNELLSILDTIEFTELDREYFPAHPGADLIEYKLSYKGHTVNTMDTAVPEALQPLLDFLNQIIENN